MARMLSVDADSIKKPLAPKDKGGRSNMDNHSDGGSIEEHQHSSGGDVRTNWRLLGLGMFFLFYLALGASVFKAIEGPLEKEEINSLLEQKKRFLTKHICLSDSDLEEFMTNVIRANDRGVSIFRNGTSVPSWSFGQAFFFATTVVTTIGYGHQSPLSSEGKVFCILYAILGIPMTLILLSAVVQRALIPVNTGLNWMLYRLGGRWQPTTIYIAHFSMVCSVVIAFLFLVPAAIFALLESGWNYLDSLYYCFISLTTIGLGDFIPGDTPGQQWRPLYKACTTFYLLIGVTAMMLTLTVFYNIPRCDLQMLFLLRPALGAATNCFRSGDDGGGGSGETGHIGTGNGRGNANATDPERIRLQSAAGAGGPKYTQQIDETDEESRRRTRIVRARSRPNDDSGDEEEPKPGPSKGRRGR